MGARQVIHDTRSVIWKSQCIESISWLKIKASDFVIFRDKSRLSDLQFCNIGLYININHNVRVHHLRLYRTS